MTDQERPDKVRNDLLGDLLNAATAVAEPDTTQQEQPAAQVQPALEAETSSAPVDAQTAETVVSAETAEALTSPAEAAEVVETAEVAIPSAEAAQVETAPGTEASAEPAAEASYVPPEESDSGRPRRVKDLTPGMELEGRITSIALYGVFVDIGVGRDGLVHISEMSDTRIDSPSDVVKIGDIVKVRVKSVEPDGRRISLTMRSKERPTEQRSRGRKKTEINRESLAALRVGDNVTGTITGISNFGVFVDIGVGKDGLVHVSELAEGRIEKPEDVVQVGQSYTFKVLEVDADGARISLSLRRAQRSQRMQQLEKGQILEGTVSGLAPFGAFIDIGVGRDGLVHISELSEGRVGKVEDAVKVGDKVTVRVLEVDSQNKRISLSLLLEERPAEELGAEAPSLPQPERAAAREDRYRRDDRPRQERPARGPRQERAPAPREPEVYSTADDSEDVFTGDATIEDLLSKYGSSTSKRDRKRRQDDEEELSEDRGSRRQRDAIRRTLQQLGDDE